MLAGQCDPRYLQREGIGNGYVAINSFHVNRMIGGDFVNIPARRQLFPLPKSLVPARAKNPFCRLSGIYAFANPLAKLLQRPYAGEINGQSLETSVGQVHVRVVEAGHHKMALEVHNCGCRPFQLQDVGLTADRKNAFAAYRQGLGALNLVERRGSGHAGVNVGMKINRVSFNGRRCLGTHAGREKNRRDQETKLGHHLAAPARARTISKMRCRPKSLPVVSNHSWSVWAPPPAPPEPMAMPSLPRA